MEINIRPIQKEDNVPLATIIRTVLEEHKMNKPGTVYTDPTTDQLYELFRKEQSGYWVVEMNGKLAGGCGIYPTEGLDSDCAELVKLYLLKEARGLGIGRKLLEHCAEKAKEFGYHRLYLESMPELNSAVGLYEKQGYKKLSQPMGNSGHYACDLWMLKDLD